jgi:hypothetical protein
MADAESGCRDLPHQVRMRGGSIDGNDARRAERILARALGALCVRAKRHREREAGAA